jgi:protoporphyrinogen oxidase
MQHSQFLIIGAGISGISITRMLHERSKDYLLIEKSDRPGGLVKCDIVDGHLFHRVGGHVFNTKIPEVGDWFWSHFKRDEEFLSAERNASIKMGEKIIGYPIENFLYMLPEEDTRKIFGELSNLSSHGKKDTMSYENFEAFLKGNFGETLYKIYFEPFNNKIWKTDLSNVSLSWLEGKLPMPDYQEILINNVLRKQESSMVHSHFFYPRKNGSQFIVNRLSEGLNLLTDVEVDSIEFKGNQWVVNSEFTAEVLIYTGDIRRLSDILKACPEDIRNQLPFMKSLQSHGTSNLLCETDETPFSWLYLPDKSTPAHRIIFTGNLSAENNPSSGRRSCTVEFSGETELSVMKQSLKNLPFNLKYIADNYEANSYVIQRRGDKERISILKEKLAPYNFHLVGRFAEWEYYNMDKAMESGMKLLKRITN